jgi:hypothetical protein
MNKKELAKFLSGFFFAQVVINIFILLNGWLPLDFMGIVFDSSLWTISLISFLFLAMFFSFLGWGIKDGKKISSLVFITFLLCVFGSIVYLFGDFKKESSKAELFENSKEFKILEVSPENINLETRKTFTLSIGNGKNDSGQAVSVDNDGNIIMAGYFQGTIDLDLGAGIMERTSLGGSINDNAIDIYLAKYTQGGRLIWGFSLGSVGSDAPHSLKTDKDGNIYLTGYFGGQMDADPTPEEKIINASTGRDAFLIKYNKDGKLVWAKSFGNPETIPFSLNDLRFEEGLDVDIDNNIYLIGVFDDIIDLDNSDNNKFSDTFTAYDKDTFIAKFDLQGNFIKAVVLSGKGNTQGQALKIDNNGNIYIAGYFDGKLTADNKILNSSGSSDCFLIKYDNNLNIVFAKRWGGAGSDKVNIGAIDVDKDNNIYLSGEFSETVYLGDFKISSKGGLDVFFVKFDENGGADFLKSIGGLHNDSSRKIKIDSYGNVYITGFFKESVDFDPGKGVDFIQTTSFGESSDVFLAKYSPNFNYIWARNFGGYVSLADEIQSAYDLAIDNEDNPIIVGSFYDQVDFHSTQDLNLKSFGASDAFLIKYNNDGKIE